MEPATSTTEEPVAQQDELFALESVQGYGVLTARERRFCEALFEGCTQREAAKRAGFQGSDEVLDAAASRAVRNVKVRSVMNQAWTRSGASIEDSLKQAAELQRLSFCEAVTAPTAERRKLAFAQWKEATALIASIHGKLTLNVNGTMRHEHTVTGLAVTIPESALPALAQLRRDVITERTTSGGQN